MSGKDKLCLLQMSSENNTRLRECMMDWTGREQPPLICIQIKSKCQRESGETSNYETQMYTGKRKINQNLYNNISNVHLNSYSIMPLFVFLDMSQVIQHFVFSDCSQ